MGDRPKSKPREPDIVQDEPGASERFIRGVRKALSTPPRKRADEPRRRPYAERKKPPDPRQPG
jgi:hypothetical protein